MSEKRKRCEESNTTMNEKRKRGDDNDVTTITFQKRLRMAKIPQSEELMCTVEITLDKRKRMHFDVSLDDVIRPVKYLRRKVTDWYSDIMKLLRPSTTKMLCEHATNPMGQTNLRNIFASVLNSTIVPVLAKIDRYGSIMIRFNKENCCRVTSTETSRDLIKDHEINECDDDYQPLLLCF